MEKPTVYDDALERISKGASWKTDFAKRTLTINGKRVDISENWGIPVYEDLNEWLDELEDRYDAYRYSTPSEESDRKGRKSLFKALPFDELIKELGNYALNGPKRDIKRAELELFVLLSLVNGSFKPEELFAGRHFFQGYDKSLVMYKGWFNA